MKLHLTFKFINGADRDVSNEDSMWTYREEEITQDKGGRRLFKTSTDMRASCAIVFNPWFCSLS